MRRRHAMSPGFSNHCQYNIIGLQAKHIQVWIAVLELAWNSRYKLRYRVRPRRAHYDLHSLMGWVDGLEMTLPINVGLAWVAWFARWLQVDRLVVPHKDPVRSIVDHGTGARRSATTEGAYRSNTESRINTFEFILAPG